MRKLFFAVLINGLALWVAAWYVPGVSISGGYETLAVAGLVLALLNGIARPVLKVLAFPLMLATLGLFSLVINGLLLWALTVIVPSVLIGGIVPLIWATLVVSVINTVLNWLT
ncbi:MAG TPA: phage holin family protein [Candidatus Paceibacterota bacterium]|nr:phage holin family protein [Candidatus Paceibacterota bacterium]